MSDLRQQFCFSEIRNARLSSGWSTIMVFFLLLFEVMVAVVKKKKQNIVNNGKLYIFVHIVLNAVCSNDVCTETFQSQVGSAVWSSLVLVSTADSPMAKYVYFIFGFHTLLPGLFFFFSLLWNYVSVHPLLYICSVVFFVFFFSLPNQMINCYS